MIVFAQRDKPQLLIKRLGVRGCIQPQAGYPPATGFIFERLDNSGRHAFTEGRGQGEYRLQTVGIQIQIAGRRTDIVQLFGNTAHIFGDGHIVVV